MSYQTSLTADDLAEDDHFELSQSSQKSQFIFDQDADYDANYENDSDYLPSSEDESSQQFSQVRFEPLV